MEGLLANIKNEWLSLLLFVGYLGAKGLKYLYDTHVKASSENNKTDNDIKIKLIDNLIENLAGITKTLNESLPRLLVIVEQTNKNLESISSKQANNDLVHENIIIKLNAKAEKITYIHDNLGIILAKINSVDLKVDRLIEHN